MLSTQSAEKSLASTKSSKSVRFGSPPIGLSRLNMKSGWPNADADRHAVAGPQGSGRGDPQVAPHAVRAEILRGRASRSRVRRGADLLVADAGWRVDVHLGVLDRDLPLVARRIPVELVVVLEPQEPAPYPVDERHDLLRVGGAGHPRLDPDIPARVRDLLAGALVAHGNRPIDARVRALELERDVLADDEARVGFDLDARHEVRDREAARRRRRGRRNHREQDRERDERPSDTLSSRTRRGAPAALGGCRARSIPAGGTGRRRSEERRVGKEWRGGRSQWPDHIKQSNAAA